MIPSRRSVVALLLVLMLVLAGCTGPQGPPEGTDEGTPAETNGETPSATPEQSSAGVEVTVVRVIDGDTVEFEYANGTRDTARLVGIDTPEVHVANEPSDFEGVPDSEAGADCLRDWGHRASEFVRSRVLNETVRLELDDREGPRDRYDRLLAYVYVGGDLLNRELLELGYATVYPTDFEKRDSFDAALSTAKEEGVGVWECRDGAADPAVDGPLSVVEVQADPPGDDSENLNGEYVVFENVAGERLDLSGWTVTEGAGREYEFPDGVVLDPGERVTLHTGSGEDTGSDLYWGLGRSVWNNDGDVVSVYDADGDLVVEREYSGSGVSILTADVGQVKRGVEAGVVVRPGPEVRILSPR